jgi:hypothetical protein
VLAPLCGLDSDGGLCAHPRAHRQSLKQAQTKAVIFHPAFQRYFCVNKSAISLAMIHASIHSQMVLKGVDSSPVSLLPMEQTIVTSMFYCLFGVLSHIPYSQLQFSSEAKYFASAT